MNNYPYKYNNQGYAPYQQPPYGSYGVAPGSTTYQSLLSKVLTLLSFSLVSAGFGLFAGLQLLDAGIGGFLLPAIILEFVVLIAVMITSRKLPNAMLLNMSLLYLFTFISGMTISTIIAAYAAAGAANAIYGALALTGVLTVGLGTFAWTTKRNLSFLGPILFIGLLAVVAASMVGAVTSYSPHLPDILYHSSSECRTVQWLHRLRHPADQVHRGYVVSGHSADYQHLPRYPEPVPEPAPSVRKQ